MRKLIPFLALTVIATGVHAQGVVTFANNVITQNTPYVLDSSGARLTGTQYAAQLYYSTTTPQSFAAHTAAPNRFRAAGSSLAGTWSTTTGANRTLAGGGVGVPVWMQVRVWNLNQFPTFEAAYFGGGIIGGSSIFQYTQRLSSPPATTDTYMTDAAGNPLFSSTQFPVFPELPSIPEPSAFVLAAPVLALLFLRRRGASSRTDSDDLGVRS